MNTLSHVCPVALLTALIAQSPTRDRKGFGLNGTNTLSHLLLLPFLHKKITRTYQVRVVLYSVSRQFFVFLNVLFQSTIVRNFLSRLGRKLFY